MKLTLATLLLIGGYYFGLFAMADKAMHQVNTIGGEYSAAATTADAWQQGNTSVSFSVSH